MNNLNLREKAITTWVKKYPGRTVNEYYIEGFIDAYILNKPAKNISIIAVPSKDDESNYTIIGKNVDEIIEYCTPLIASKKRDAYRKLIADNLKEFSAFIVDRNAGNDVQYLLILDKNS